MRCSLILPVLLAFFCPVLFRCAESHAAQQRPLVFETVVRPLIAEKCGKCHNLKAKKGDLDMSTMAGLRRGGESGESAIADSLEESLLWIMIDGGDMPPQSEPQLSDDQKSIIRKWIESGAPSEDPLASVVTQHQVLPFIYARCVVCHGRRKQEGGLDLRTVQSIRKGGKSGPAVLPGEPQNSLLLKRVLSKDMPPPRALIQAGVRPLEVPEIELITTWIEQGAKRYEIRPDVQTTEPDPLVSDADRQFWAFQRPKRPVVPESSLQRQTTNAIDAFLLRNLRQHGLTYSVAATRPTLIRRVAFDLTGLPPEWEDVQRFRDDESPNWYAELVDFYLESPHYGERWGRYWLDLSGYADSEGKRNADSIRQHAWRYRDYVIRSLNADKPYNRFLLEQLAGDELYDFENAKNINSEMMEALVATGFLRMAPDGTGASIVDTVEERFEVVADEIEVLGSSVMGLTLQCAQCHTHKYDPIPQRDYYRLVAVFQGAYDVYDWLKPTTNPGRFLKHVTDETQQQWDKTRRVVDDQIAAATRSLEERESQLRAAFIAAASAKLPDQVREDVRKMLATSPKDRTASQQRLAAKYEKQMTVTQAKLQKQYPEFAKLKADTDQRIKKLKTERPVRPMIRALWDRGEPSPTWIFRRGEFTNPGDFVGPGVLSVLSNARSPFVAQPKRPGSTGRRLAFAEWLIDPQHPLTARVLVNRVWYQHFGRGIVASLANFGKTGTRPTHPDLLDWLAATCIENGWSLKWLHRQIMNSTAYRQSSQVTEEHEQRDPDNRWLSRMPMRRLEAESIRDSLLAVSGKLDTRRFGEPDLVTIRADGLVTSNRSANGWRRTIYVQQRRKELPTILETFDLPQMSPNCVQRSVSTVAPQALHLLNNALIRELALEFAKRIESEVSLKEFDSSKRQNREVNWERRIERVYQIAVSRPPSRMERQHARETLDRLSTRWELESMGTQKPKLSPQTRALANLCHVMMNSAAFLYVD